jgi:superfamily II DNA or RNA helicase
VAKLIITAEEAEVHRLVGTATFLEGRRHVHRGEVVKVQWHAPGRRAFGEVGGAGGPHSAIATLAGRPGGAATSLESSCTCMSGSGCPHAVALLLAAMPIAAEPTAAVDEPAVWQRWLAPLVEDHRPERLVTPAEVGLQFELLADRRQPAAGAAGAGVGSSYRVGLRPVLPGREGGWVRTGISWSTVGYGRYGYHGRPSAREQHRRVLGEILHLASTGHGGYYGHVETTVYLESISSRRIWDLFEEASDLGLPLVQAGSAGPVLVYPGPGRLSLAVGRDGCGLELEPRIDVAGEQVLLGACLLLGEPAHGIAWWQTPDEPEPQPRQRILRLAPLAGVVDVELRGLLARPTIRIPQRDAARFLADYYPALRRRVSVVSADDSVDLPQPNPPTLALAVSHLDGQRMALAWEWSCALGETRYGEPLWPASGMRADPDRDRTAEADILRRVTAAVRAVPELLEDSAAGHRLAAAATLGGDQVIRLLTEVLPALGQMPDVEVTVVADGTVPDYRQAGGGPVVRFSGAEVDGEHDWFDLAVSVSVDGEDVPFGTLFVALAERREYLILPSGTYFSLDRDEFGELAALIAESRAMQDTAGDTIRLSRFHAGMWEELERIGVVSGQAAAWQQTVRSLRHADDVVDHPPPRGLHATLRPYQLAGFNWLAALHAYRLGGILADDMGLGKTLQALALICHAREQSPAGAQPPFLVVAPTSVIFNWVDEAARFAPGLSVAAVTETEARRGGARLADVVAGADLVVTSYTLFRLEYADYETMAWAGLLLDEAQSVKNHQSQTYHCARKLPAPYKLAITGTPMENNLMELWSLLSITAPGLFANPTRFTEYYRKPIEKGKDTERLAQLRRRIRPLMLRRTKQQVISDLPDKQEQVIELELNPRHKKVYQTYLQRERQKVLGLLGDLARNRFEILRSLTLLRQASLDVALVDPKHAKIPSTKLDAMADRVADMVAEGHRTLIFSQFTRFLDAARRRLDALGIAYCYLDGSTRNRAAVLDQFKTGDAPVFLISLKAGGFGLNLTEADYCILLDPWWNPATEAQAVDRIHRIGQTNKVMVYRLVAKDTIEEKVMALKAKKAELFNSVVDHGTFESTALSTSDIRGLLE